MSPRKTTYEADPPIELEKRLSRKPQLFAAGGFVAVGAAAVLAVGGFGFPGVFSEAHPAASAITPEELREVSDMTVDDEEQILAQGEDAQERNAQLPTSRLAMQTVDGFELGGAGTRSRATAEKCLTQAIYFEAAHEPLQGRRAVAQVVLNRLRHKAYPSSVCGVVYEGSQRRTGCQFSFTCDGSLLRKPVPGPWREAEKVASEALAGRVEKSVGTATHYHADYVLPKWAFQLGKITQLGRHIFYRFRGGLGRSVAFNARYSGVEHMPSIDFAALRDRVNADGRAALVPGLTVTPHVTDRHAKSDVGGRLDVTKPWRLSIPDPVQASSRYKQAVATTQEPARSTQQVALADNSQAVAIQ